MRMKYLWLTPHSSRFLAVRLPDSVPLNMAPLGSNEFSQD